MNIFKTISLFLTFIAENKTGKVKNIMALLALFGFY